MSQRTDADLTAAESLSRVWTRFRGDRSRILAPSAGDREQELGHEGVPAKPHVGCMTFSFMICLLLNDICVCDAIVCLYFVPLVFLYVPLIVE